MPRLILKSPEFGGQSCELAEGAVTLGRSRQNQIVLLHETVSAQHCEFLVNGSDVILRDLGSRNGTFVDGVRLKVQSGVRHGQPLRGRVDLFRARAAGIRAHRRHRPDRPAGLGDTRLAPGRRPAPKTAISSK